MSTIELTGIERTFPDDEIVVTKTDKKGLITYANDVFLSLAGYTEDELLGKPHNLVRHPDMPKCIFKLLWDNISSGKEICAYVVNRSKNGDHYWVYAHVTPWIDTDGNINGFHSSRRVPDRKILENIIQPIYDELLKTELSSGSKKDALIASSKLLNEKMNSMGFDSYEEFIHSLK